MQFATSIVQSKWSFIKLPEEHSILKDILMMETIVQVIEASFYLWLVFNFRNIQKWHQKDIMIGNNNTIDVVSNNYLYEIFRLNENQKDPQGTIINLKILSVIVS